MIVDRLTVIFRCTLVGLAFCVFAAAADWRLDSGDREVTLVELFTSQGCSSCPPAERWLNTFRDSLDLWTAVVPVAFHVDYWDRLGWRDPFASRDNSDRQYAYRLEGRIGGVYTPGFVVNGREWRAWFRHRYRLPEAGGPAERLQARLRDGRLEVRYGGEPEPLDLHVTPLGFGLETAVGDGENQGRTLHQDFVALGHRRLRSQDNHWSLPLGPVERKGAKRLGLALWVSRPGDMTPLQAVGGWWP